MGYAGVDVFLETFKTMEWPLLFEWYSPFLVDSPERVRWRDESENPGLGDDGLARRIATNTSGPYDALLIIRPDLIFKPLFSCALAQADRSKVLYTFVLDQPTGPSWLPYVSLPDGKGRADVVADAVRTVPASRAVTHHCSLFARSPGCRAGRLRGCRRSRGCCPGCG